MKKIIALLAFFLSLFFFLFLVKPQSILAQGCVCKNGLPSGPYSCPVSVDVNDCDPGWLPICPATSDCTSIPPCNCEPVSSLDCGQENEECCPGDVCEAPTQCTGVGYGYTRCLRPCTSKADCNLGEICNAFGGCVNDPFSEDAYGVKIPIFCDAAGNPTTDNTEGKLYTAIGCIPFKTGNLFIRFILSWGIGIAGGIAFILIIIAGFQITTSQGDPKKLQAGRELLTSAIAGLVLLIFSVLILRLIGVNLLGIPGFGS